MRPSNTHTRRQQIVDALVVVMAQKGYDGASVADIAQQAHLTPGLLHYHFKSKREILLALLERMREQQNERWAEALNPLAGNPAEALVTFVEGMLGLGSQADASLLACWIMLSGEALRDEEVRVQYEALLQDLGARLEAIVSLGQQTGALRGPPAAEVVGGLLSVVQGYFVLAATARSLIPKGSAARTCREMLAGLLHTAFPAPAQNG